MLDFIVDFYSHELQLAIEIDRDSHNQNYKYDIKRQVELEQYGVQFLRFDDKEVKRDISNVLRTLESWILKKQQHSK
jgi:very-short-patch-repair endonuclease